MRLQRRERIVRDLRTRGRYSRDKCRLSRIRKTDESNVRQQLQLELKIQLLALASSLMIARRAIRRSREVRVAETAAAATRRQPAIAVVTKVVQQVACRNLKDLCSNWNANNQVFPCATRAIRSLAVQTARRDVARVVPQVQQRVQRIISDEDYVTTASTVSA